MRIDRSVPTPAEEIPVSLVGLRVLISEDEGITQMQVERILTYAGLEVVGTALTGREAVEIALRERPALILMDIQMPEMDGLEAVERIRAVYNPCIVVVSAYNGKREQKAREMGVDGYIKKPMNCDSLLYDITRAFSAYSSSR